MKLSLKRYRLLVLFVFIILGGFLVDLLEPTQSFSELENRHLATFPRLTLKNYFSGDFTQNYEKYVNDQFFMRDFWISIKSRSEYVLGKQENNEIIYGKEGYMFEKFTSVDSDRINYNLNTIKAFAKAHKIPTDFILIPSSYAILSDYLPKGVPMFDQLSATQKLYEEAEPILTPVSLVNTFLQHKKQPLYYRTDHHWTTYGAYLAYKTYMNHLGIVAESWAHLPKETIDNFYGTYYSKSKLFNAQSDIILYSPLSATLSVDGENKPSLYDHSKWSTRDKYSAFLWGNNGVSVLKASNNESESPKKILVFKDSFGNSMVPFLTLHFDEVHVIDLRALTIPISEYMDTHTFDRILFMYNFINFAQDTNFARLKQ